MSIALTATAAKHVRAHAQKLGKPCVGLRLAVRSSGCTGLAYALEFADKRRDGELEFDSNGIKLITDPKSYVHVAGTVLDYVREGVQEGFRFNNPNVKNVCGCGESFNT